MAAGEPALPRRFRWRTAEYTVVEVVSKEREFRPEGHKSGNELYLRKHWVKAITTPASACGFIVSDRRVDGTGRSGGGCIRLRTTSEDSSSRAIWC